jgi:DNA processing protein
MRFGNSVNGETERYGSLWLRERGYPVMLAAIHDPPRRLFVRGDRVDLLAGPCVAVVGARSCTRYGAHVARSLGRELARAGAVVVSGLARGIDGEAHRGALEATGATIAVLGCGIDRDYPRAHAELARRIVVDGLIVSEYPPGVEPAPWRFPARNRIVAGLSVATVVVEARERSGALITAEFALEEGREVLAVPGEITSGLSDGTNALIRQGAAPLLSVDDVLDAVGLERPRAAAPEVGDHATVVLAGLRAGALDADGLARATGLPASEVAAALVELELAGLASGADGLFRATL